MAVEHIQYTDTLRQGADKINAAIDQSNEAIEKATTADINASQALALAQNVQTQLDTIVIEGDSSVEAAQARVDADNNVYPTLKDRLDAKETMFSEQINDINKLLSGYAVNVKSFGAVGDGVADDTQAIKDAIAFAEANLQSVYLPAGKYYVTSTLEINLMNSRIFGDGGTTEIIVKPTTGSFTGNAVLLLHCSGGVHADRYKRLKTCGHFSVLNYDNDYQLIGLQLNVPTSDPRHAHIEGLKLEEIFIKGFAVGLMHGDSVYKYIFERLYIHDCMQGLDIPASLSDAGEASVFKGCWFVDGGGGRIRINRPVTFENCSIHPFSSPDAAAIVFEFADAFVTFSGCHFEHISSETEGSVYKEPWFDVIHPNAFINFNDCVFLVSGSDVSNFKECVIRNKSMVKLTNCNLRYFLPRLKYDQTTLNAAGAVGTMIKNIDGGQSSVTSGGFYSVYNTETITPTTNKSLINDYAFNTMTTEIANEIFKLRRLEAQKFDEIFSDNDLTYAITIENFTGSVVGGRALKLTVTNAVSSTKNILLGIAVEIPDGAKVLGVNGACLKIGGTSLKNVNEQYQFYDAFGHRISDSEVMALNNDVNLFNQFTADNTWFKQEYYRSYRKIPDRAKYAFISLMAFEFAQGTHTMYIDYFLPFFL